jgi:pyruvate kinase
MLEKKLARTKIIATLGPSSARPERIRRMVKAGVDAFRLNMSHGNNAAREKWIGWIREIRAEMERPISIMVDLRGPRIRLGELKKHRTLRLGEKIWARGGSTEGKNGDLPIDYRGLSKDVSVGDRIRIRDGRAELKILEIHGNRLLCKVRRGTQVASFQGVNLPDCEVSAPALSARDRKDLAWAVKQEVDWIALSFVRSAKDVASLQRALHRLKSDIPIIAKIEHPNAIKNLKDIIAETDAVMVARGDLAVEVGHAKVPLLQRRIIRQCLGAATPVIVATQMLESMIEAEQPTRAEVSDVANAVAQSADAVMLSGETAMGNYPVQACQVMHDILIATEEEMFQTSWRQYPEIERIGDRPGSVGMAVAHSAIMAAHLSLAKLVLVFTESGRTSRLVASFRADLPFIGITSREKAFHRMSLIWGVLPGLIPQAESVSDLHRLAASILVKSKWIRDQDLLVALAGTFSVAGGTNTISLIQLQDLRQTSAPGA